MSWIQKNKDYLNNLQIKLMLEQLDENLTIANVISVYLNELLLIIILNKY